MFIPESYLFKNIIPELVSKYGDNNALGFVGEEFITYSQMGRRIEAVIAFMEAMGIEPGDRVILYSQNMPNWGVVYFATQCMGVVVVPVLPDFNAYELGNIIEHSEAKAIFISKSLDFKLAKVENVDIGTVIRLDDFDLLKSPGTSSLYDEEKKPQNPYSPNEDVMSVLLYTSGTTGTPKGVMLSQRNLITNIYQSNCVQDIVETDRFLSVLPLSHTYENTIGFLLAIVNGASIHYLRRPPSGSVLLPALEKVKPTMMLTVPLIIERVYKASILRKINSKAITRNLYKFRPTQKLLNRVAGKKLYETFGGQLKFFGIGGAKLDAQVERFLIDAKFPFAIGYGLTETSPLIAGCSPGKGKHQAIGPKVVDSEIVIHNPDPKSGEGEIWFRGNNVMLGYYKNEEITKEVLTDDGWFKTGDLGSLDKDGILTHKGRLKSMIVGASGENIYPEEIESLINNFKFVEESLVIEDKGGLVALVHFNMDELEERLKEVTSDVTVKIDDRITELKADLLEYINSKVNKSSKLQDIIDYVEPFKKTATNKIKRYLYKVEDVKK
ncbi:MAG: long-chain fatty acid--CoA ligase [Bacteroidales bacterium]|nr:long-chain fatty acid--CoA ligase [Bacteroidales bacterium]